MFSCSVKTKSFWDVAFYFLNFSKFQTLKQSRFKMEENRESAVLYAAEIIKGLLKMLYLETNICIYI